VTQSLIEQWFPAATVGAESLRDASAAKKPPTSQLHVWWARRPLTASRAAVVASLLPAWPSDEEAASNEQASDLLASLEEEFKSEADYREWFVRSLGILGDPVAGRARIAAAKQLGVKLPDNGYGYKRAFTVSPSEETINRIRRLASLRADVASPPTVLDPFAGGGSIPFEAARYGCATTANELNPVAAAILEATVSLPATLGSGFAKLIESWGRRWGERVEERLTAFFPHAEEGEVILGYVWAHTVPCPTTGRPTPLAPDFWLSRGNGDDAAISLDIDRQVGTVRCAVVRGPGATEAGGRSTYKDGTGTSIWTDETFGGEYIRDQAVAGGLGQLLLAVSTTRPASRGRQFRPPTQADVDAVASAERELERKLPAWEISGELPSEEIDGVSNYDRGHRMYGINRWSEFFAPRQLLTNVTALEELHETIQEAAADISDEDARGLSLYLALALDKAVDYNSRQSSWDSSRLKVRNTFDKHNFAFKWTFAEFDGAHSLVPWAVSQVASAYAGISTLARRPESMLETEQRNVVQIVVGSAAALPLKDSSVDAVVTDPPYYDNVMYAECSDYFYVWLKRSLREMWPGLVPLQLSDKQAEAVANPALFKDLATHSGRGKRKAGTVTARELADRHYEHLLTRSFAEAHRVLKPDGVMTVMFTHKRVDAWDTLGQALLEAGFSIESSWPVHTESEHSLHQAKKNAASSTILLTCRKRGSTEPAWWSDIRSEVERAVEDAARRFAEEGIRGVDLTLATFGPTLSVLSRRWPVYTGELDDEGRQEVLRPDVALDLAREKVTSLKMRGLLAGRDVEFDRVTDWYLLAWSDFQAAEFPFDEARKLSIALHLDVDELKQRHKIVRAASGTVTLLTPAQRRTAGALDSDSSSWETQVDALHALMLVYDEEGLGAAQAWLERTGRRDDQRFVALVEAALNAIPRVRQKEELIRPEARILESMRQTLFPSIEPPVDPTPPAEQLVLETA
jgi:adenine-specific DNA methylase